jgi:hypothetical protein
MFVNSLAYNKKHQMLYKMLIYETGSHFTAHRDSEKEDGMFGTFVLLLPSKYTGGQLCIEHAGKSVVVDYSEERDWRCFAYAAFYADCMHELKPVTSGYRVALTFNLCVKREATSVSSGEVSVVQHQSTPSSVDCDSDTEQTSAECINHDTQRDAETSLTAAQLSVLPPVVHRLADAFTEWRNSDDYGKPEHVVIMLEHQYTQASLSRENLKGTDKALMSLIEHALSVSRSALALNATEYPPVIPLLCLLECHRSSSDYEEEEYRPAHYCDEDDPRCISGECEQESSSDESRSEDECGRTITTSYSVSDVMPLSISPAPPSLDLFHSAVQVTKLKRAELHVLRINPEHAFACLEPFKEHEQTRGNESTSVDRYYHKAGIVLVKANCRWEAIAYSAQDSYDDIVFARFADVIKQAFTAPKSDVAECLRLSECLVEHCEDSLLSQLLTSFIALRDSVRRQRSLTQDTVISCKESEVTAVISKAFAQSPFDSFSIAALADLMSKPDADRLECMKYASGLANEAEHDDPAAVNLLVTMSTWIQQQSESQTTTDSDINTSDDWLSFWDQLLALTLQLLQ